MSLGVTHCFRVSLVTLILSFIANFMLYFLFLLFKKIFLALPHSMQDRSSQLGMKPMPPAVEAGGLNHWTTREVLCYIFFYYGIYCFVYVYVPCFI